jgi:hypothetical protein
MRLGKYQYTGIFEEQAILPPFKGSAFRGAFGHALKKAMCVNRKSECAECLLAEKCLYATTFENSHDPNPKPKRIAAPPLPYMILPPSTSRTDFRHGDLFQFELRLFGNVNDFLPYFIFAVEQMGKQGIGKRTGECRGRFSLQSVSTGNQLIFQDQTGKLDQGPHDNPFEIAPLNGGPPGRLTLTINTPLRLKFENQYQADLPFHLLVRAMLRRISSLFGHYGGGEPALDYRELVRQANSVETIDAQLKWYDWKRYSNRQKRSMLMGGIIGKVTYHGDIATYLPLLEAARHFHLGKQTTFGLGSIDFQWEPDS